MKDKPDSREFITTSEAATVLRQLVSPRTISRWARQGRIPALKTLGGQYRIRRADLDLLRQAAGAKLSDDRTERDAAGSVSDYRTEDGGKAAMSDDRTEGQQSRVSSDYRTQGGGSMIIIAVSNPNKGGVGKTTTAIALGAAFAQMGMSVLLVDLDKQTHETKWLGVRAKGIRTIYHLFDECITALHEGDALDSSVAARLRLDEAVVKRENFYLIPGSSRAGDVGTALASLKDGELILSFILRQLEDSFDICIIDCPPQAEQLNNSALAAADFVLVPLKIGLLDLDGVAMTMRQVEEIRSRLNPNLQVLGVLPTFFVERSQLKTAVMEEAGRSATIAPHLMASVVPQSTVYGQLPGMQASPFAAGRSEAVRKAANTYARVAGEALLRTGLFTAQQVEELVRRALMQPAGGGEGDGYAG